MNILLKWELDWIDKNAERYDSIEQVNLIKHNIMKRYLTNEISEQFKKISIVALLLLLN